MKAPLTHLYHRSRRGLRLLAEDLREHDCVGIHAVHTTPCRLFVHESSVHGTAGLGAIPNNAFGFGFMQIGTGCAAPAPRVDVWLRDDDLDTGVEPFTGPVAWLSPDIEVLDSAGNPVSNPTYDPVRRFNNIIRVTVRNRGTNMARNTEVHFYWADPATNIPFPAAWNTTGIYNDAPGFVNQSNMIVIPQLAAGASTQVQFG